MITIDEQIIALVNSKNTLNEGFKLLMHQYQERLYHHIRSIVNNHNDTDDVLQNTFIKIFKHISKFKGKSNLYTWMYRIATNEALTFLRKNNRINEFIKSTETEESSLTHTNNENMDGKYIKIILQKAIDELPPKQKAIFSLRYFEELSYKDISEIMDTSIGALKASYHHAVKKVEKYIKKVSIY